MLAYNLVMVGLNFYGLVKPGAIDREALVDLHDPIVQKLSKDAELIAPYQTLLRPIIPAAFGKAKILSKHTFDRVPPYGVKMEKSLAEWPSDLLESSLQERGRSIVQFMFRCGAKPSANPVQDVEAIKIIRTDGIVAVKFINENRVWGFYLGESFDPITPAPPSALLGQLKRGYVVEITNEADATRPVIKRLPFEEAKHIFEERFSRSLMEGLVEKQSELSWRPEEMFHNAEHARAMTQTVMATTKSKVGTPSPEWRDAVKVMRGDIPVNSERRGLTAGIVSSLHAARTAFVPINGNPNAAWRRAAVFNPNHAPRAAGLHGLAGTRGAAIGIHKPDLWVYLLAGILLRQSGLILGSGRSRRKLRRRSPPNA